MEHNYSLLNLPVTRYAQEASLNWNPCFVDLEQGHVFFDGVFIESDTFTESRLDRVMPVLEEEQIYMCRQMLPLLKSGKTVLDIGTGSGVFAIWAAKHGCRVIALDINQRAIDTATKNANLNHIRTCQTPDQLKDGSICFQLKRFDEKSARDFGEQFDLVFLAPPYNPTFADLDVALHAAAGEDGQKSFREQIHSVPLVLKKDGWAIGTQFGVVCDGTIETLETIKNSFKDASYDCSIRYSPMINSNYGMRKFLEAMYASYLSTNASDAKHLESQIDLSRMKDFIERVSAKYSELTLVYFEVNKGENYPLLTLLTDSLLPFPDIFWENRIWAHQCVVEYRV